MHSGLCQQGPKTLTEKALAEPAQTAKEQNKPNIIICQM